MIVVRKEKETNQQVLRRFNRIIQSSKMLNKVRDNKEYVKEPNRSAIKRSALRRERIRRERQWY